jgi:hypothetical protein
MSGISANSDAWRQEMERRARARDHMAELDPDARGGRHELDRERCRRSFETWLGDYGWMHNPHETRSVGRRQVPFVPWPSQLEASRWLDERREAGEEGLILKSRKLGLSWLVLHKVAHGWLFDPGFSALLGSKKEDTVDRRGDFDSLFEKLRWLLGLQPAHLLPAAFRDPKRRKAIDKHLVLKNPENGAEITGEATHPNFGAAGRRSVVFIDEFGRVEDRVCRQIWKSVETVGGTLWLVSNPTPSKAHFVNEIVAKQPARKVKIMAWQSDPTRPTDFRRRMTLPDGRLTEEEFDEVFGGKSGATATGNAFRLRRSTVVYHEGSGDFDPGMRETATLYTGLDFGTGPKSLAAVGAMIEWGAEPIIRVDCALGWPGRTPWIDALRDLEEDRRRYGELGPFTGDPAGVQTQRDAQSYVGDLQAFGFRWHALQPVVEPGREALLINKTPWKVWAIKKAQAMMDDGHLKIHERCEDTLLWSMERWSWNVPDGATVDDIRGDGQLRKDLPSHACEAFLYVLTYCLAVIRARRAEAVRREPEDYAEEPDVYGLRDMLAAR